MFVGHYAVSLAANRADPSIPLTVGINSVQFLDVWQPASIRFDHRQVLEYLLSVRNCGHPTWGTYLRDHHQGRSSWRLAFPRLRRPFDFGTRCLRQSEALSIATCSRRLGASGQRGAKH